MNACAAREFALAQAAIASALIEMEAMKVANLERERHGHAPAYGEDAFLTVMSNMQTQVRNHTEWIQGGA